MSFCYKKNHYAVNNLSLSVEKGKMTGILGPNGAGKSTLLNSIIGSIRPDGDIQIDCERNKITYIPQKKHIDWNFPVSVIDVVLMAFFATKRPFWKSFSKDDYRKAEGTLKQVGLFNERNKSIDQLSGGQQQKVFIARALLQNGDIVILDEPFVGIDATSQNMIVDILHMWRDAGKTILVVHHDFISAARYFDSIILLNKEVIAHGTPKEVFALDNLKRGYGMGEEEYSTLIKTVQFV